MLGFPPHRSSALTTLLSLGSLLLPFGCSSDVETTPGTGGGGGSSTSTSTSTTSAATTGASSPTSSSVGVGGDGPGTGGAGPGTGGAGPGTGGFDTGTGGFDTGTGGFDTGTGGFDTGTGGFDTGTGGGTGTGGFDTGTGGGTGTGTGGGTGTGTGTGGGEPLSPCGAELSELVAAFRADALVEAGFGDGDVVQLWEDEGPDGLDVGQIDVDERPTLREDEIGGHAVLRFDGADDHLLGSLPISAFGEDPSITMIVVARASALSFEESRPLLRFGEPSANGAGVRLVQGDPGLGYGVFFQSVEGGPDFGSGVAHDAAAETSVATVWTGAKTGAALQLRKNGVEIGSDTDGPILAMEDESFGIGVANPGFSSTWMGDIAEVLVFGPQLDEQDVGAVEACLADRYGL